MNHPTRVTAAELAPAGIRVNAVLPGLMKTPMVAHNAFGSAYGDDLDAIWRAHDAQVPLGRQGDAWTWPRRLCSSPATPGASRASSFSWTEGDR